jgi:DNA invertase Pin-like site-specific DNA recombinase
MNSTDFLRSKISNEHRAKAAYIYLRQSTPGQVMHNTESTARQYALTDRAVALGWPEDRIHIIDEDLGRSGATSENRFGFQHLIAEVGMARVGLVLSLEASRLSRNSSDWCRLLELCSIFGTLIADSEVVYDPRSYHDRLLLGLAGIMSEAELHHIKMRLEAGRRFKAARGELQQGLPAGLERLRSGEVILSPDEEVQSRLRLVFDKFRELGSGRAITLYLRREGLKIPMRHLFGPGPHEAVWVEATASRVNGILVNPAYAGAYVYGRRVVDQLRKRPGATGSGIVQQPMEKWEVCIQDRYPAYISWEEYVSNRKRLTDNQNNYRKNRKGIPREGRALLQGIALCGLCGSHMSLHYDGKSSDIPVYSCFHESREYGLAVCQQVRGSEVDQEVERLVLKALEPDSLNLALDALEHIEREAETLERQWKLRIERARYEATRAERQFNICEPENRLVARNLERQWEEKLRTVEEIEREFADWRIRHNAILTEEDKQQILALGTDLPRLWTAASTTNADRKQIIRLVIKDVVLNRKLERGKVWFKVNWQTGATTEHWVKRRTGNYQEHADGETLKKRVGELISEGKTDEETSEILRSEGYRTSRGGEINSVAVFRMRKLWGIQTTRRFVTDEEGIYSLHGAAAAIDVAVSTVHTWVRKGILKGEQLVEGGPWKVRLSEDQIPGLKEYAEQRRPSWQRKA